MTDHSDKAVRPFWGGSGGSTSSRRQSDSRPGVQKPASNRGRRSIRNNLTPKKLGPLGLLIGPAVLIVAWEIASLAGWLSTRELAAPSTAIATGYRLLQRGVLLDHFLASAGRAYAGLAIGVVTGLIFALVSGLSRIGEASIDGIVQVKRAVPTLALIPLALLWLGIGEVMKVAIISLAVFVPVYINTHAALRGIDMRYVELARTLGLTRWEFIRRVALPGALPGFLTGLRLAVTTCWTALVVLEQIATSRGIGYLMMRARDYGQTDVMVLGIAIYASLGLLSDFAVRYCERRALSYRKVLGS